MNELDRSPWLRQKEEQVIKVIEALGNIQASSYWTVLVDNCFGGVRDSILNKMRDEKDEKELYRLQGQLAWADKFCNLDKLAQKYRDELQSIRHKLKNGTNNDTE